MRLIGIIIAIGVIGYVFFGDSASSSRPDLRHVNARAEAALKKYDEYLKKNNITQATDKEMAQLTKFMQKYMNVDPRFYKDSLIAMKLQKDAKFEGYKDTNSNGAVDSGEKKIFTVEIDSANKRLIATDTGGQSVGRTMANLATGFFVGAMMSNLLNRQSSSGIKPGSFNNRKVTSSAAYSRARSRARSGGRFGGK